MERRALRSRAAVVMSKRLWKAAAMQRLRSTTCLRLQQPDHAPEHTQRHNLVHKWKLWLLKQWRARARGCWRAGPGSWSMHASSGPKGESFRCCLCA